MTGVTDRVSRMCDNRCGVFMETLALWLALMTVCALSAAAQRAPAAFNTPPVQVGHISVALISSRDVIHPGSSLDAGLYFKLEPGWHVYWVNAGDSGEAPRIRWALPAGVTAEPMQFPAPKRLPLGPLMDFGYENEVVFPMRCTRPPRSNPARPSSPQPKSTGSSAAKSASPAKPTSPYRSPSQIPPARPWQPRSSQPTRSVFRAPCPHPPGPSLRPPEKAWRWPVTHLGEPDNSSSGQFFPAQFFPSDQNVISNPAPQPSTPLQLIISMISWNSASTTTEAARIARRNLVKSAVGHRSWRNVIRRTWGRRRLGNVVFPNLFMIGRGTEDSDLVCGERKHQTSSRRTLLSSYYNNTLKTMASLRWGTQYCRNAQYLLLIDDDYYLSVKNLLRYINVYEAESDGPLFAGTLFPGSAPMRHRFSKWFVSLRDYSNLVPSCNLNISFRIANATVVLGFNRADIAASLQTNRFPYVTVSRSPRAPYGLHVTARRGSRRGRHRARTAGDTDQAARQPRSPGRPGRVAG